VTSPATANQQLPNFTTRDSEQASYSERAADPRWVSVMGEDCTVMQGTGGGLMIALAARQQGSWHSKAVQGRRTRCLAVAQFWVRSTLYVPVWGVQFFASQSH
jgi:hypothetical protein